VFVDSHCHLDFPDFAGRLAETLAAMARAEVTHALCVCVSLDGFAAIGALVGGHPNLHATVGVHPDHNDGRQPTVEQLCRLADYPKVVAIGETGLDYYRLTGEMEWQRERFRTHVRAARACGKPLVIHTREAGEDTMRIMIEERAEDVGGVMHCFTESIEIAQRAIELGFFISFSGIVTFRNATALKEVARAVPLDKILIETDSPYLAPVPHRGKVNQPAYVRHVAEEIARLKGLELSEVATRTSANYFQLFKIPSDPVQR